MKNFESIFAAYLLAWGILFIYQVSVGRRIARVEAELRRLKETLSSER